MHHIIFVIQYHIDFAWAYILLDLYHCFLLCYLLRLRFIFYFLGSIYSLTIPFHGYVVQVAKDSADVIILDENFMTIVNVVRWGRAVYINNQKFLQFQLTVIVVALVLHFASACISGMLDYEVMVLYFILGNNRIMRVFHITFRIYPTNGCAVALGQLYGRCWCTCTGYRTSK